MGQEIKSIISTIFPKQELDIIQNTEKTLKQKFGKQFFKNNIKPIYWNKSHLIIETRSIEAKTEINLIKKQLIKPECIIIK